MNEYTYRVRKAGVLFPIWYAEAFWCGVIVWRMSYGSRFEAGVALAYREYLHRLHNYRKSH
jgi:hypothetical protein